MQKHIDTTKIQAVTQFVEINSETLRIIREKQSDYNTRVINLIKSIEKIAEEAGDDPYLVGMAERAKAVRESYEDRQTSTAEALAELTKEIESNERRKKEQAAKGFDGLTYFVYSTLREADIPNAEIISKRIRTAFVEHPNWTTSEKDMREVQQKMTFAIFPEEDDFDKVTATVDKLLTLLMKAQRL